MARCIVKRHENLRQLKAYCAACLRLGSTRIVAIRCDALTYTDFHVMRFPSSIPYSAKMLRPWSGLVTSRTRHHADGVCRIAVSLTGGFLDSLSRSSPGGPPQRERIRVARLSKCRTGGVWHRLCIGYRICAIEHDEGGVAKLSVDSRDWRNVGLVLVEHRSSRIPGVQKWRTSGHSTAPAG